MIPGFFFAADKRLRLVFRLSGYLVAYQAVCALVGGLSIVLRKVPVSRVAYLLVLSTLLIVGSMGVTWIFRRKVDGKSVRGLALPGTWASSGWFGAGLLLGGLTIGGVVAIEVGFGWAHIASVPTAARSTASRLLVALLWWFAVALSEELAMRGYVLQNLAEQTRLWLATLVTGFIFVLLHVGSRLDIGFIVSLTEFTFVTAAMRQLSKSLWLPIGYHAAWDWLLDVLQAEGPSTDGGAMLPIRVFRHGPSAWVGQPSVMDSGLIPIMAELLLLGLICALCRPLGWTQGLAADGTAEPVDDSIGDAGSPVPCQSVPTCRSSPPQTAKPN